MVASGSDDGTVRIWKLDVDNPGNEEHEIFDSQRGGVNSIAFSPDRDTYILASCTEQAIDVWDPKTGQHMQMMGSPLNELHGVAFSPEGTYLASGSYDNVVYLWYALGMPSNSITNSIEPKKPQDLALSPNGRTLVVAQINGNISLWDIQTNELLNPQVDSGHTEAVLSVSFSPMDGAMLLSSGDDRSVCVCDVKTGKRLYHFIGHTDCVVFSTWSPDGAYVASTSRDTTTRIWKIGQENGQHQVLKHGCVYATGAAFSPDGKYLVTCHLNGKIVTWTKGQNKNDWEQKQEFQGHRGAVFSVLVSPNSKHIISSGFDKTIRTWDIDTGQDINSSLPIKTAQPIYKMWFDIHSDNHVITPYGAKPLDSSSSESPSWSPYWRLYKKEGDEEWIMWHGKKVIFLSRNFRPGVCGIFGHKVVVCTERGQVHVYGFSETDPPGTPVSEALHSSGI